jgi:short-subunit dehydrogenase
MLGGIVTILGALAILYLGYKLVGFCFALLALIFIGYLIPQILCVFMKPQDLRAKYDAKWAVVTGSSSGIGKAIAERLAKQGINVVLVALPGELLDGAHKELSKKYGAVQFRKVGVNLGQQGGDYLNDIIKSTDDIDVNLLFNNAGFMLTGFFDNTDLDKQMLNMECNATSAVRLTHHFVNKMTSKGLRGGIVFTSSAAMCQPTPFTVLYSATKAFVSVFAAGIAGEVKSKGIDVMAIHPSPVNTNFYVGGGNPITIAKLDALDFFKRFLVEPETLPDRIFASLGYVTWLDIGPTAYCFRMMMKLFDYNAFAFLIANFAHTMGDFKRHAKPAVTKS